MKDTRTSISKQATEEERIEEMAQDMYFGGQVMWDEADVSYEARPDNRERGANR